jgi:hypothetical protein
MRKCSLYKRLLLFFHLGSVAPKKQGSFASYGRNKLRHSASPLFLVCFFLADFGFQDFARSSLVLELASDEKLRFASFSSEAHRLGPVRVSKQRNPAGSHLPVGLGVIAPKRRGRCFRISKKLSL